MRRSRIALLMVGVVTAVGGYTAHAVSDPPVVIIKGWGQVVDPDQDCRIGVERERVNVTVPGSSHEFAAELKRWNAPRILQTVSGDFIAEVKVCGDFEPQPGSGTTKGRKPYHGGGLLLVADDMNHLSLHRGSFREGDRVQNYLNFMLRRDGKIVTQQFQMSIPAAADCYVRLERHGDLFIAMFSPDHVSWQSYTPIENDFPTHAKIGAVVVNSTKEPFSCGFEDFTLFERKGTAEAAKPPKDNEPVNADGN